MALPCTSHADPGNNYCITPAFVSGNIPPNLLLMIDNSASMYDLEFVDRGKKHCSITTTTSCYLDSDCPSGETCSVFDRQPYYCYDQTYSELKLDGVTANTYQGYFQTKDSSGNDIYYTYDKTSDSFLKTTTAFPAGCGTHSGTTTKIDSRNNTVCVEYDTTARTLTSFVAKGSYLNWISASKFDIEKQILTGGKFVSGVCNSDPNRACASSADCNNSEACNAVTSGSTFLMPESRGCVGQRFLKDAITSDRFVNYNTGSTNPNTQLGITFATHGPINKYDESAPSWGGQTYIDLFAGASGQTYNYSACQTAIQTISSTTSSNAAVKQSVAACLSGAQGGTCSNPPTSTPISCFSTFPDCYQPGRCSGNTTMTCLTSTDCGAYGTCNYSYYCEGPNATITNIACTTPGANSTQCPTGSYMCDENNTTTPTISCLSTNVNTTTGCTATYWCDWGAAWMSSADAAAPNGTNSGYTCYNPSNSVPDPACAVQNTQQGKCSLPDKNGHYGNCQANTDCSSVGQGTCIGFKSQGSHYCVQHTPSHGTCQFINGATNGICGGIKDYGICQFGASDNPTKQKVSFQQSMQACWQYNKFVNGAGGQDIGIDDIKTAMTQCASLYNGQGSAPPYRTCSNNPLTTCTSSTDCGGNTCNSGPNAIAAGNSAYICGLNYIGGLFYLNSGTWVQDGSFNDSTTTMQSLANTFSGVSIPSQCAATDTFKTCATEVYQNFCQFTSPGVPDPTDAPSDTSLYDNVPAILTGVAVQSQLGAPIAVMRARVNTSTPSCSQDSDCTTGNRCSSGVCKPAGLIQQYGGEIRLGAMKMNRYGSATEATTSGGVRITKICSNDPTQLCTQDADCGGNSSNTIKCNPTVAGTSNLDGGNIIYPVGLGTCATMTSKPCSKDSDCPALNPSCLNNYCGSMGSTSCTTAMNCSGSSQACIRTSPGDHSTADSLVQKVDSVRAYAWTPFAEAFYNALGYFGAIDQGNGTFKSRAPGAMPSTNPNYSTYTGLRLNSGDYNENQNPSENYCQLNNILLVTDGSSTADKNSYSYSLGSLYASKAGVSSITGTACPFCCPTVNGVDYAGTPLLPVLSWIGSHENLANFSTSAVTNPYIGTCTVSKTACAIDKDCPAIGESCSGGLRGRDYVSTYVVFNGTDNGNTGVCDAPTLLKKTATNGGTTMQQASDPAALSAALSSIFQNIAAKSSSGTAASILSNSEGSGANILQAVFYPSKIFSNNTSANWIGEMQNLWYYVDPAINNSTIREDTDRDHTLNLLADKVVSLQFNSTDNTTYAYVQSDSNGDGSGDTPNPAAMESADDVASIWRAGKQLWARDLTTTPRTIYTTLLPSGTQVGSTGLMTFTFGVTGGVSFDDNSSALQNYLQMSDNASTVKLMKYVHGFDFPTDSTFRNRTVQITKNNVTSSGVWKLGDIISSTPRIQSNMKLNSYSQAAPGGYSDASYSSFISSNDYLSRGMVYVGANDGMLHAFKMGQLDVTASGYTKARLLGTGLGEEQWAFIPKQALPYLKYYSDPAYSHIYYLDGSTTLVDASIGDYSGGCDSTTYDTCTKNAVVVVNPATNNSLDPAKNTWRTVLIGGMGMGGATTLSCPNTNGSNCVQTPTTDPANSSNGLGYSSYYALDVSDPNNPSLLWEFSNTALGYATTGPAVVRIGDATKNGRWYAVFGSGPTGPIDTSHHQFMGNSDQTLKFFVVDLRTGKLVKTIDTLIPNAFAGSMTGGTIDTDRWNQNTTGNYQDDAIFVGYTKKNTSTGAWTDGGVLRIVTNEALATSTDTDKAWTWSTIIDGIGPVTTGISRLQDRKNKNLWLYFGTGRYYSRSGTIIDDYDSQRAIFGIKDPCYNTNANPGNLLDKTCMRTQTSVSAVSPSAITDQTTTITPASGVGAGWKVNLDASTTSFGAERVVTDAVALTNGAVFVTSFAPTADVCGFGGNSFLWALDYQSGGRPQDAALTGKALIQLSTGAFQQLDLTQVFGSGSTHLNRRANASLTGKPPSDAFPVVSKSSNKPVKRILHIQER